MDKLPLAILKKVEIAIDNLSIEPRPSSCKKLKGSLESLWRIRIGDYRVIIH